MLASRSFVAAIPPIILLPGSSYPRQSVVETTDFQLLTIGIVYVCFLRPRSSLIVYLLKWPPKAILGEIQLLTPLRSTGRGFLTTKSF